MPKKEKLPKQKKPPKQAKHVKQQKKRKGRSVQDFIGVKTFTKYGLMTQKGELLFYLVSPTNISVLSYVNIEIKIRHLMMVLSSIPDIEITCTDSSEWHLLDFDPLNRRNHYIDVIKQCGFKGRFSTYHIKTSMIKQEKSNPYKKHINSKKEYLGKGRYLFEQIVLRYYTVNCTPTRLDVLLFIPRIVRCGFWLLIDSIKRK